jgi:hypothetical protein
MPNMTTKKLHSNEIAPEDAPEAPRSDAGFPGVRQMTKPKSGAGEASGTPLSDVRRVAGLPELKSQHPGVRDVEAALRQATAKLKEHDPKAGRSLSDVATAAIAWPDSDALRGLAAREALRNAHVTRYGTPEEKRARRAGYQAKVDQLHRDHPRWSYEQILNTLAKTEKCSTKTLTRYTTNPRKKS